MQILSMPVISHLTLGKSFYLSESRLLTAERNDNIEQERLW